MKKTSKKGPIEIIENKGIKIPIYLSPRRGEKSYVISYYVNGVRQRERLSTLAAAETQARKKTSELTQGTAHVGTFSAKQTAVIESAISIIAPTGFSLIEAAREVAEAFKILDGRGSIIDACRFYIDQASRREIAPKLFSEIVDEFLTSIRLSNRSFRYWQDCSNRLGGASFALGDRNIGDIHVQDLENFLNNIRRRVHTKEGVKITPKTKAKKATGKNRNNYRRALNTLFQFAKKKGYLPRNVPTEAEYILIAKEIGQEIGIYTPVELKRILEGLDKKWVPFAAIGAFAGARTAEIHRLDWEDVRISEGYIIVAKAKSKTGTRRVVPILPCLASWLKPYYKKSGPICPQYAHDSTMSAQFSKSFKQTGVASKHNGFRHSFASYRLAQTQNAPQTTLEMGTSIRKLMENYRELVPANKGQEWFDVFPSSGKNTSTTRKRNTTKSIPNLRTVKESMLSKS